jgi:CxxC motif-containing protein (DUF1111 family)
MIVTSPTRGQPARRALRTAAATIALGCGPLLTEAPDDANLFDAPLPGLTSTERAVFARGDAEFSRRFATADGLGPIFNNVSCASCHSGDGRGRVENALLRIGSATDGFLRHLGGPQIQDRAIPGAEPELLPAGVPVSVRLPPPVFGAGLIEAIPDWLILDLADPNDANGDGISGRPNWVAPPEYLGSATQLGRFGRKAQTSSLLEQVVEAYHQDMGITTDQHPTENRNPRATVPSDAADHVPDPEVSSATVGAVIGYLRTLAPPAPGAQTTQREQGKQLFGSLGCAACHVPELRTGAGPTTIVALTSVPVPLYSDLLLHDMGEGLADNRPDGSASGREWRTAPLWGLRLMREFLNGDAFLLHDGRARSVQEAILLHGGEAKRARDAFAALADGPRRALLDFVESR